MNQNSHLLLFRIWSLVLCDDVFEKVLASLGINFDLKTKKKIINICFFTFNTALLDRTTKAFSPSFSPSSRRIALKVDSGRAYSQKPKAYRKGSKTVSQSTTTRLGSDGYTYLGVSLRHLSLSSILLSVHTATHTHTYHVTAID